MTISLSTYIQESGHILKFICYQFIILKPIRCSLSKPKAGSDSISSESSLFLQKLEVQEAAEFAASPPLWVWSFLASAFPMLPEIIPGKQEHLSPPREWHLACILLWSPPSHRPVCELTAAITFVSVKGLKRDLFVFHSFLPSLLGFFVSAVLVDGRWVGGWVLHHWVTAPVLPCCALRQDHTQVPRLPWTLADLLPLPRGSWHYRPTRPAPHRDFRRGSCTVKEVQ